MTFIDKMILDGVTYEREKEDKIIALIGEYMERDGFTKAEINYYFNIDEDFLGDVLDEIRFQETKEVA